MPYLKQSELYNKLRRKEISPVYIFAGEETLQQQEAYQALFKTINTDSLNSRIFYGNDASVDEIILDMQTLPFLSDKRLLLLKDAQKLHAGELNKLAEFLKNPVDSSCLVIFWQARLRAENKKSAIFKAVDKSGVIVDFRTLYERELPAWIQQRVLKHNKRINYEAIQYLIEESGSSLLDLDNEIEKLVLFTGKNREIKLEDVEILSGHTSQTNLNQLQEAIEAKNLKASLKITESLLSEGEVPLRILATIYRALRRLLLAKSLIEEENHSNQQVMGELRMHPYFARNFFLRLSGFKKDELSTNLTLVLNADRQIKSTSKPHSMIFEELLYKISEKRGQATFRKWGLSLFFVGLSLFSPVPFFLLDCFYKL